MGAIYFDDEAHERLKERADVSQPRVTVEKQMEFLSRYLDARSAVTGERGIAFNLAEVNYRHVFLTLEEESGGHRGFRAPFSHGAREKVLIPFYSEMLGRIDIDSAKIVSVPSDAENVKIQLSIRRPASMNRFSANYCGISAQDRARLSESKLSIYERVVKGLQNNACFVGRPALESDFVALVTWTLRKLTYCVEEPSFLKDRAHSWLQQHSGAIYLKADDDLFLPFIQERLHDEFGSKVQKKPQKFGGEIDLLFSEIPIELKVRRGKTQSVTDVVDEKFRPASQAAPYAASTRLGVVFVLDLPSEAPEITNIDACVKVITKIVDDDTLPTSILVCVFHCNLPKPSSALLQVGHLSPLRDVVFAC